MICSGGNHLKNVRTAVVLATVLVAGIVPAALGETAAFASTSAPALLPAEVGNVASNGPITVTTGSGRPTTLRLKAAVPGGVTGPLTARIRLVLPDWPDASWSEARTAALMTSTCAVDGGEAAPCTWRAAPDPAEPRVRFVALDLPTVEAAPEIGYAVTIGLPADLGWMLGSHGARVQLRDPSDTTVSEGELQVVVDRAPETRPLGAVHARDRSGVLWRYEATGRTDMVLKARERVGGGWNAYSSVVPLDGTRALGTGDLVARDKAGVLWYYKGTGDPDAPFAPRVRVGGGWNTYTALAGHADGDLVARDRDGVLWNYTRTGLDSPLFKPRVRVGGGWNAYDRLTTMGRGVLARGKDGVLWKYDSVTSPTNPTGPNSSPARPFAAPTRVGGGWKVYTAVAGTEDIVGLYDEPDVVARDASGQLWAYENRYKSGTVVPGGTPVPVGYGWNIYDMIF